MMVGSDGELIDLHTRTELLQEDDLPEAAECAQPRGIWYNATMSGRWQSAVENPGCRAQPPA